MSDATTLLLSSQGSRALARVLISGYVDAYALLNFGVYASFMTGNTTSGGAHAGEGNLAAAGYSLLPIPFFVIGILGGTLLVHADRKRALRRFSVLVCRPARPGRGGRLLQMARLAGNHATQHFHGFIEYISDPGRRAAG